MFQRFHLSAPLSLAAWCVKGELSIPTGISRLTSISAPLAGDVLNVCVHLYVYVSVCLNTFLLQGWVPSLLVYISLLTSSMCSLKGKENGTFRFLQTCSVLSARCSQISMSYENKEEVKKRREEKFSQCNGNGNRLSFFPPRWEEGNQDHKSEANVGVDRKWCCWHCFNNTTGDLLNCGLNRKSEKK